MTALGAQKDQVTWVLEDPIALTVVWPPRSDARARERDGSSIHPFECHGGCFTTADA